MLHEEKSKLWMKRLHAGLTIFILFILSLLKHQATYKLTAHVRAVKLICTR